jgi:hypothetical protein
MATAFPQDSPPFRPARTLENMRMYRIFIAVSVLALALTTTPGGAFAQDEPPATFKERYPA